jgi:hypothetical protein
MSDRDQEIIASLRRTYGAFSRGLSGTRLAAERLQRLGAVGMELAPHDLSVAVLHQV